MTLRRAGFLLARAALHGLGLGPVPALFIMSHMRSGSTLLLHLLLTTPEIIACGERGVAYRGPLDLDKLAVDARIVQRAPLRRVRYAADQIHHDHLVPEADLLRHDRVRCLFLIRDPPSAIASLVRLSQTGPDPWSVGQAADYYTSRLATLARYATTAALGRDALALTYDDLVHHTPATLGRLQAFLGLHSPLREQYARQPFTGRLGDRSVHIQTGQVVRHRPAAPLPLAAGEAERAEHAYRDCARALQLPWDRHREV